MTNSDSERPIDRLLRIMTKLRDPETGCPWDVEQDFRSIAAYTIEEAYEVADAIERNDLDDLKDELGDLLLQVVFHSQMAREESLFDFDDVATAISDKMERRHPHVFGDRVFETEAEMSASWNAIKAQEKAAKADQTDDRLPLARDLHDIPVSLPALIRAQKLQWKAAKIGFDWPDAAPVKAKVVEELAEVEAATGKDDLEAEFGDLLFAVVNWARHMGVDPDVALRRTNQKFVDRLDHVERQLDQQGKAMGNASLDEMEAAWQAAKEPKAG